MKDEETAFDRSLSNSDQALLQAVFKALMFRNATPSETQLLTEQMLEEGRLDGVLKKLIEDPQGSAMRRNVGYAPGHFYSPLVNVAQAAKMLDEIDESEERAFHAINISPTDSDRLWDALVPYFQEAPWGENAKEGLRYYYENTSYPYTDALVWSGFLRHFKPKRVLEIGSGFSTAVMLDTLDCFFDADPHITLIQPFPHTIKSLFKDEDWGRVKLVEKMVQDVELDLFQELGDGDVLFIDSTHVVKTGSDVVFEINEILPRLKPGVLVHFHDIFYPFEYPKSWVCKYARSWNEIYALRAYLQDNPSYKILMFNNYQVRERLSKDAFQFERFLRNPGGGIWLQRVA